MGWKDSSHTLKTWPWYLLLEALSKSTPRFKLMQFHMLYNAKLSARILFHYYHRNYIKKMYQYGLARYVRAVFVLLFLRCTTVIIEIEP